MSMTLGEKLRQAREARGFTLNDIAEQTRISGLYLESIENDDYRVLPGGIFNKGFVKSYAKCVGIKEEEALSDYSQLMANAQIAEESELRLYKPEVLTDDRTGPSMTPTIITALVILGLMTGGILLLLNYLQRPAEEADMNSTSRPSASASPETPANAETTGIPDMATLAVELKATNPVTVLATVDSEPQKKSDVAAGSSVSFSPKESLTLSYNRWNAPNVQLSINGKAITLPAEPLDPKDRDRIIFTISHENLAQIWNTGAISTSVPPVETQADANTAPPPNTSITTIPPATVSSPARPTPAPRPSAAINGATTPAKTPAPKPANAARSAPTPAKTATNN
ncbi:MAG: helix-turn-helix domain-containing protein [Pyrinomonadaceae bacterium]|nr:helix-turn-helix domain-containing protein [Pyrinomonadaceae bacterium]